jgi:hypothetical protein
MDVMNALSEPLRNYIKETCAFIEARRGGGITAGRVFKVEAVPEAIRSWFAECESSKSWSGLVLAWKEIQQQVGWKDSFERYRLGNDGALKHWFRRRGVYSDVWRGQVPNPDILVQRLIADTETFRDKEPVWYLFLLNSISPIGGGETSPEGKRELRSDTIYLHDLIFPPGEHDLGEFKVHSAIDSASLDKVFLFENSSLFYPQAVAENLEGHTIWCVRDEAEVKEVRFMPSNERAPEQPDAPIPSLISNIAIPEPENWDYDDYWSESGWLPFDRPVEDTLRILLLWRWRSLGNTKAGANSEDTLVLRFIYKLPQSPFLPLPPFPTPRLSIPEEGLRLSSFEIDDGDGWGWVWDPDDGHVELDGYVHFDEQSFDEFATFIRAQSERSGRIERVKRA